MFSPRRKYRENLPPIPSLIKPKSHSSSVKLSLLTAEERENSHCTWKEENKLNAASKLILQIKPLIDELSVT